MKAKCTSKQKTRRLYRQIASSPRYVHKFRRALQERVASWSASNTDDEAIEEPGTARVVEKDKNTYDSESIHESDVEIFRKSLKEVSTKKVCWNQWNKIVFLGHSLTPR